MAISKSDIISKTGLILIIEKDFFVLPHIQGKISRNLQRSFILLCRFCCPPLEVDF